jgi:sec-independent protein translocase protein TatA
MIAIVVVALLLFGSRIPTMARSLGSGIVEFKKGLRGDDDTDKKQQPPTTGGPTA